MTKCFRCCCGRCDRSRVCRRFSRPRCCLPQKTKVRRTSTGVWQQNCHHQSRVISFEATQQVQDAVIVKAKLQMIYCCFDRNKEPKAQDLAYICHANVAAAKHLAVEDNTYTDTIDRPSNQFPQPYIYSGGTDFPTFYCTAQDPNNTISCVSR